MSGHAPFRFQARIRMIDTDSSGRIHHTAMLRYFEEAEMEFLRTLGINRPHRGSYNLPRVHIECDFLHVVKLDDVIDIEVSVTRIGRSSLRFEFQSFSAAQLVAKGAVVAVCADFSTLRPIPIPDDLRARLSAVLTEPGGTASAISE